jgi:hypothetical protein
MMWGPEMTTSEIMAGWHRIHELNDQAEYTARRVMQESKVAIEIMRSVGKIAHRKLGYD